MKNKLSSTVLALLLTSLLSTPTFAAPAKNPDDPYERYNRFMFGVNDKVDRFALKPVAKGYRKVTPGPVRKSVSNFFNNLRDVYSIASNLLRADFKKAANDTMRVAINTTWGIGGLFDIATEANLDNNQNTLGDTFASWGWKNSNYFVYPILGPSTVRDTVSSTITVALPGTYGIVFHGKYDPWGAKAVDALSVREQALNLTDSLETAALDPYAYTRDIYMSYRKQAIFGKTEQVEEYEFDEEGNLIEEPSSSEQKPQSEVITQSNNTKDLLIPEEETQEQNENNEAGPENTSSLVDDRAPLNIDADNSNNQNIDFIIGLANEKLLSPKS